MAGRAFLSGLPLQQPEHDRVRQRRAVRFRKEPLRAIPDRRDPGIRAGEVNEIWVGIRDAYYGRSADPERPLKLRKTFNIPLKLFGDGFQDLDYPVWNCPQSGILSTPTLVAAGGVSTRPMCS